MEKLNYNSLNNIFGLKNNVAVITGGYSYLGESLTKALLLTGCTVYVAGKNKVKFKNIFKNFEKIKFVTTDISDSNSVTSALNQVFEKEKRLDILVNNAIFSTPHNAENINEKDWSNTIDGVLTSTLRCINAAVPIFKKRRAGSIINIGSIYGVVSPDFRIYNSSQESFNPPAYSISKSAIIGLTRYFASYLSQYNIRVNCVSPGAFPNKNIQRNKQFIDQIKYRIPLNRIGHPEDLMGVVIFLASNSSAYITGQNIIVDGGWTIR